MLKDVVLSTINKRAADSILLVNIWVQKQQRIRSESDEFLVVYVKNTKYYINVTL